MKLIILGSGTAIPHPERGASGYALIADDGTALLLECGPGSTRRWPAAGLDHDTVCAIVNTHHHVDHCGDLPALLFARNVADADGPLVLAGPVGHGDMLRGLEQVYGSGVEDRRGAVDIRELRDGDQLRVGPFVVTAVEVEHVPGALGLRVVADGVTAVFSGDSGPCEALDQLCRGADLALLECSYPAHRPTTKHLNAETAAQTARRGRPHELVLTHFYPECDEVDIALQVRAAGYEGPLHLAQDLDVIPVRGAGP